MSLPLPKMFMQSFVSHVLSRIARTIRLAVSALPQLLKLSMTDQQWTEMFLFVKRRQWCKENPVQAQLMQAQNWNPELGKLLGWPES